MIKNVLLISILVTIVCGRSYPLFKQCDGRWGNQQCGTSGTTICQTGCLITSVTSALVGCGWDFNPSSFNQWLLANGGYYDGGLYLWSATNRIGLVFQGKVSNGQIRSQLDQGKVVICNVRGGTHWVLAYAYDGDTIYVNDSGFNRGSYDMSQIVDGQNGIYLPPGTYRTYLQKMKSLLKKNQPNLSSQNLEKN